MQSLVSVLISIYNPDPHYLAEQIKSIDTQTYSNIEIVVYNDNPNDANREMEIKALAPSRIIKYHHGEKNLGYIKAFEKLVGLAAGEYIALCDQDDIWNPNRVERGVIELEKGYVLAVCDRSIIDAKGTVIDPSYRHSHPHERECNWNSGDDITAQAAFSCYAIGMATMVRRDVAAKLTPFPQGSGHDLWIAAGASALGKCAYIDEPLVRYRRHGNNVSGLFSGIQSKDDWYQTRVKPKTLLAETFQARFPNSVHADEISEFAGARQTRNVIKLFSLRRINPRIALFEILLRFTPDPLFSLFLKLARRKM